jgi:hypothetical protein
VLGLQLLAAIVNCKCLQMQLLETMEELDIARNGFKVSLQKEQCLIILGPKMGICF